MSNVSQGRAKSNLLPGEAADKGWSALNRPEWVPSLVVLLAGVLLHSMNVLLLATVLPSIVVEIGGAALMSWPTTAFLASSIVAATCGGLATAVAGPSRIFSAAALIFGAGALLCALAPSIGQIVVGRFVQGFGGGLLSALAYVLVRKLFPEALWPRVFALLAGVWTVSVLVGPLVGGAFATYGDWRYAFFAVAALAAVLALSAFRTLPRESAGWASVRRVPGVRVALICGAIAVLSLASVADSPTARAGIIGLAIAALAVMLWLDRSAAIPLLPRDAFSLHSTTGVGLWIALLLCIAFSPLQIFVPIFLQRLHDFDPMSAGYTVASASMAWTAAAVGVAALSPGWSGRLIIAGPCVMGAGLLGIAVLLPSGPVVLLFPAMLMVGAGIGASWAFTAQRIMGGARRGEEDIAAGSVATAQQAGLALGAAFAGLVANSVGFSAGVSPDGIARAALWIPASFISAAVVAGLMGARLRILARRLGNEPESGSPSSSSAAESGRVRAAKSVRS